MWERSRVGEIPVGTKLCIIWCGEGMEGREIVVVTAAMASGGGRDGGKGEATGKGSGGGITFIDLSTGALYSQPMKNCLCPPQGTPSPHLPSPSFLLRNNDIWWYFVFLWPWRLWRLSHRRTVQEAADQHLAMGQASRSHAMSHPRNYHSHCYRSQWILSLWGDEGREDLRLGALIWLSGTVLASTFQSSHHNDLHSLRQLPHLRL
jgi:hypothetical protein